MIDLVLFSKTARNDIVSIMSPVGVYKAIVKTQCGGSAHHHFAFAQG